MKRLISLMLVLAASFKLIAQAPDITGTWNMFEMSYLGTQGAQTMTEDQMKANSSSTEYVFMEKGKFRMSSNMSGSGTMDTYEGTWKLADNKLTYSLTVGGQSMDIVWDFELKDNIMKLTRTSPDGSMKIVNSFRKKSQ